MAIARSPTSRRLPVTKVALAGAGVAAAGAGVWLLRVFDPNAPGNPFPPCLFYATTGWHCPGCGMTRCLHALVHGDLGQALAMNPLMLVAILAAPLLVAWRMGWRPRVLQPLARWMSTATFWLGLIALYGIARNLPWAPFSWLAPG
ncbi:DUF2752 domain-containing protein [Luteimonas deserti]|uniref:DUF2752 domain-containing protein n=1 Tax=Luteimonas deserti TaxID=2752306 RepID=A0A7Z0TYZ8_9GAMM|nr:DUF2752 domain-containing protein [Luteimonas deserti]NYZ62917.1 DUF2752 domain-containing protein [Luteimonas deserti]